MKPLRRLAFISCSTVLALAIAPLVAAQTGEQVLKTMCAACHIAADGSFERIDAVRKTPEAWDMTVVRMMRNHHVPLSPDDRTAVVRYLAQTRGLSVKETEGRRYILEKEPVAVDIAPNQMMTETCSRCHSFARVALQRRTAEDWEKLLNFHLGQFPTLELQALARDRDWWTSVNADVLPFLAKNFPLGQAPKAATGTLAERWMLAGHQPGRGDYTGSLSLKAAQDGYDVSMTLDDRKGTKTYTGQGVLLGEGEWRATLSDGQQEIRQVLALNADGSLTGRWFEKKNDVIGGRLIASPVDTQARILSVSPSYLRTGGDSEITLVGVGLSGKPVLPKGVTGTVVSQSSNKLVLKLSAEKALGAVKLSVGKASAPLVVFSTLDRVGVEPEITVARVGGNGGPIAKVPAQFEAIGFLNGPDGKAGTDDDIRVGAFTASWAVDNWDEGAAKMQDAKYAGSIEQSGRFTPANAGLNPERPMSTNNLGNLKVIATVDDDGKPLQGEAHLYVTVQRFVDTPIR
ncbi:quinohemoprotein amine dehydrogenase subunit alpha [Pseudomonas sp. MAFF 302030]|uniref:Quinohemoprotein amine dehydrogenase subunit alpha n=1 Tax=Pseudomonas morbosilactucae TaxID=2938197 RepID=A0A9X1Z1A5_9PSED|nr:quinohemoprotein amine dehydrogenase subunit alpha [Pseudomonas morbosilactucae]MCK9801389.1 quinohemoprotein amine dehydrogenase subunit alpha [Pseudomonas morbosilactucae]